MKKNTSNLNRYLNVQYNIVKYIINIYIYVLHNSVNSPSIQIPIFTTYFAFASIFETPLQYIEKSFSLKTFSDNILKVRVVERTQSGIQ
jgi:hypothetical protein